MSIKSVLAKVFRKAPSDDHPSAEAYATTGPGSFLSSYASDGSKYPYGISGSGHGVMFDHRRLRQNVRTADHETLAAHGIIRRMVDTVVDKGLKLEPTPVAEMLGMTDEQAEEWSADVAARFDLWARDKKSCTAESMTFYQAQRLVELFQQRDNDYFIRLHYSPDTSLQSKLQISFVDPEQIYGDAFTSSYGPLGAGEWEDGIRRDAGGKELAYKIWIKTTDGVESVEIPAIGEAGRRLMLHGFQQEYAGQRRGFPLLAHALQELQNLTDFSLSEIIKAINQSQIWAYVKPGQDNVASDPLAELNVSVGATNSSELAPVSVNGVDSETPAVTVSPVYEKRATQPGGLFVTTLQNAENLEPFKSTSPSENFSAFVNAFYTNLMSSVSMPPEVGLMKFSSNYSASRGALLLFWRVAEIWREELASDFLNPVYESWLSEEIAAGRVTAPGWSDPRMRAAWLTANWIGAPIPNIDPSKTADAISKHIRMGLSTQEREARNLNGSSAKANNAKNKRTLTGTPLVPWENPNNG